MDRLNQLRKSIQLGFAMGILALAALSFMGCDKKKPTEAGGAPAPAGTMVETGTYTVSGTTIITNFAVTVDSFLFCNGTQRIVKHVFSIPIKIIGTNE